jgi:hypothetical protein
VTSPRAAIAIAGALMLATPLLLPRSGRLARAELITVVDGGHTRHRF